MNNIVIVNEGNLSVLDNLPAVMETMLQLPQADCPVTNTIGNGQYIRELHMSAGTLAIGHYQRFPQMNKFIKGKVLMLNKDGTTKIISAPMEFIGEPGQKIGFIIEDVIWQNVFDTDLTDITLLENYFFDLSNEYKHAAAHRFALESIIREEDRQDFHAALIELNYTEEQVHNETHITIDLVDLPNDNYKAAIAISAIADDGVIATANISAGETIGPARIGIYRTPFGRYTNHSKNPNAEMKEIGDTVFLVATRNIKGSQGGYRGEEVTVDYRRVRKEISL